MRPRKLVVAALMRDGARILVSRRRADQPMPGLWEFPGGKVEPGESDQEALKREVRFRLNVGIEPGKLISFVKHAYERYAVELYLYEGALIDGAPSPVNVQAFRWAASREFEQYSFTPADEASMTALLGE
jgi:mutator protein MutT